ncbi:serine O-acetyltransferase EpsC [Saccharopolyspora gloriosae]|uniref:Serine acetyltransferase n=1 Tax=Saccharopolyspora gloriosae TaxID=455344 RepID=A0A840NJ34_9PSEU|nr:serine O-acetyltransferase EpsC [Saccharopolyspora gloriosae]MBB5070193.1 serine O-acetyltransferase [Saccharopolyspora gloriosae]
MKEDLDTVLGKDPSVRSRAEALLHASITALWTYRIAHRCYRNRRYVPARVLANAARILTGIEIHPGARIGRRFFVDHGAAVVIGETCVIGDDVMLYHQVTLGSVGWWKDGGPGSTRHPVIGDHVVVGTNASVLGAIEIGAGAHIAAHAVVTRSVLPGAVVHARDGRQGARTPAS